MNFPSCPFSRRTSASRSLVGVARGLVALAALSFAPAASPLRAADEAEARAVLRIEPEIDCPGCEDRMKRVLETTKGVRKVEVDLMESRITVRFDPAQCTVGRLLGRIEATGYHARSVK